MLSQTDHIPTPAVFAAIKILDALARAAEPLTLSEISRRAESPKASTHRILTTLQATRMIELEHNLYRIGPKVLEYHAAYARQFDLTKAFYAIAERIVGSIDETTQLARPEGAEMVFIAKLDCQKMIRPATYVGRRVPAYATAVGKAILATLDAKNLRSLYPEKTLPALTPHTLTTFKALQEDLMQIRTNGYARTREESTLNLCCVAAPIFDATGHAVAALSICMATNAPETERLEKAIAQLRPAARELSQSLGYFETV
jgi:DNA-binding IclR family transcriptional regulator